MPVPSPNAAVLAAKARRAAGKGKASLNIEWFIEEVSKKVDLTMHQRVKIATEFLRSRILKNISRPVTKGTGPRGGKVVFNRSKPGEYPKAETTQLMKTLIAGVRTDANGQPSGYVGTPLDYGLILETRMDRSFLVRTLNIEKPRLTKILTGPIG